MLTEDVKYYADRSVLCWLATTGRDSTPNVSPKEIFTTEGDTHFLIANIASPMTVRNIRSNPDVCVSFVDVFEQQGYKLRGRADLIRSQDQKFARRAHELQELAGEFTIRSIIAIEVRDVSAVVAPRSPLHPGTTVAAQVESAMRTYGVQPRTGS